MVFECGGACCVRGRQGLALITSIPDRPGRPCRFRRWLPRVHCMQICCLSDGSFDGTRAVGVRGKRGQTCRCVLVYISTTRRAALFMQMSISLITIPLSKHVNRYVLPALLLFLFHKGPPEWGRKSRFSSSLVGPAPISGYTLRRKSFTHARHYSFIHS